MRFRPREATLRCLGHFDRWMSQRGLDAKDLDEEVVAQFLNEHLPHCRCPAPVVYTLWRRTVRRFLLRQFRDGPIDLSVIKPEAVRRFVADQSAHYSFPGGIATLISALRVDYFYLFANLEEDNG